MVALISFISRSILYVMCFPVRAPAERRVRNPAVGAVEASSWAAPGELCHVPLTVLDVAGVQEMPL